MASNWYVLARLAELVERGDARLQKVKDRKVGDDYDTVLVVRSPEPADAFKEDISDEEQGQLCEMLSSRFMERAISLGITGKTKTECASEQNCISCLALPGEWCRPTHAGERDSGGWVHPERESGNNLIGALRDSKHIQSAMFRFDQMHFSSKRAKGVAFAQILHAGLKFGLDMSYWGTIRRDFFKETTFYFPDIASGEDLSRLAESYAGVSRCAPDGHPRTDEEMRASMRDDRGGFALGTLVRFFASPPADAGWVGKRVTAIDTKTVTLITDESQISYGTVVRVDSSQGRSVVDIRPDMY